MMKKDAENLAAQGGSPLDLANQINQNAIVQPDGTITPRKQQAPPPAVAVSKHLLPRPARTHDALVFRNPTRRPACSNS